MVMREYFNVYGGNSGLTESIIYWNPPKNKKRTIVVYSGATLGTTLMGNVDSATMINCEFFVCFALKQKRSRKNLPNSLILRAFCLIFSWKCVTILV